MTGEFAVLGWYGKLPSSGDFTGRGLPYPTVASIDEWFQAGLVQLRHRHPDWQYFFSHSPIWSFLVPRGLLAPEALIGCLMPSRDGVGRAYPLVALRSLRPNAGLQQELPPVGRWHGHAIELMLDAHHEGFSVERFDAEYRQLALSPPAAADAYPAAAADNSTTDVLQLFDAAVPSHDTPAAEAVTFWGGSLAGWDTDRRRISYWWTLSGGTSASRVVHEGPLTANLFITLLTRWDGAAR